MPLNAGLFCQGRIIRRNLLDQKTGRHARRNADALWSRDFRHSYRGRTDDAPDPAARRASGNAPRDATRDAATTQIRGRFLFFDHLNFFWNLGGGTQLAVDDFALHLHHLNGNGRRRGWWRGRRWGRYQEGHQLRLGQRVSINQGDQDKYPDEHDLQHEGKDRGAQPPLGPEPVPCLNKAVFKHKLLLRTPEHYENLDTGHILFAPTLSQLPPANSCLSGQVNDFTPDGPDLDLNFFLRLRRAASRPQRHGNRLLAPATPPILVRHQNRRGNRNRGISPDQDSDDQGEAESMQHLAAEKEQRKHGKESQPRCQDRSAQSLINAFVDNVRQLFPSQQLYVLPYAVKHHDGVVIGVSDQGQDGGDHGQRNFPVQKREGADRNQSVVENRQHGGDPLDPLEAEPQVDQHSAQRIKGGQDSLLAQLLPHLRADNLDVADTKVRDVEVVLERGDDSRIGHTLQLIIRNGTEHAAFRLVAIVDNRLSYRRVAGVSL